MVPGAQEIQAVQEIQEAQGSLVIQAVQVDPEDQGVAVQASQEVQEIQLAQLARQAQRRREAVEVGQVEGVLVTLEAAGLAGWVLDLRGSIFLGQDLAWLLRSKVQEKWMNCQGGESRAEEEVRT